MDYSNLIDRLSGIYRIPIKDGLGAVGAGEEPDNPDEFVRRYEGLPPIQGEAAAAMRELVERADRMRKMLLKIFGLAPSVGKTLADYVSEEPGEALSERDKRVLASAAEPFKLARIALAEDNRLLADAGRPAAPRPARATTVDDGVLLVALGRIAAYGLAPPGAELDYVSARQMIDIARTALAEHATQEMREMT